MRSEPLNDFVDALQGAIAAAPARPGLGSGAQGLAEQIFGALADPAPPGALGANRALARLPVCEAFELAVANAGGGSAPLARLAAAFAALDPALNWRRRAGSDRDGAAFHEGHANTYLVGPEGLEQRRDVVIGASLLAPNVSYPAHHHPPPELYVALSEGEWFNQADGWYSPGPGGLVHHAPGIVHAMRAGAEPLLAVWCLWTG